MNYSIPKSEMQVGRLNPELKLTDGSLVSMICRIAYKEKKRQETVNTIFGILRTIKNKKEKDS